MPPEVSDAPCATREGPPAAGGAGGFGGGGGGGGGRGERGGGRFGGRGAAPGGAAGGGGNLVERYPFEVRFIASQPSFQEVLNDFAAANQQFLITRTLVVANSNPKPVAKAATDTPAGGGTTPGQPEGTPQTSGTGNYLTFIVGTEKVEVVMRIDIVAFNPPEQPARKGAAPNP